MSQKIYVAYGSNLNKSGMASRCPDAKPIGKALIENWRLVFRGVADLEYVKGALCPVGLWRISERDEEALDRYEGVSSDLYGKYLIKVNGEEGLVYLMHDWGIFPPSAWYVSSIRDGYRNFGLEEVFLDDAIKHAYLYTSHSKQTQRRRDRQKYTHQHRLVKMPEAVAKLRMTQVLKEKTK